MQRTSARQWQINTRWNKLPLEQVSQNSVDVLRVLEFDVILYQSAVSSGHLQNGKEAIIFTPTAQDATRKRVHVCGEHGP